MQGREYLTGAIEALEDVVPTCPYDACHCENGAPIVAIRGRIESYRTELSACPPDRRDEALQTLTSERDQLRAQLTEWHDWFGCESPHDTEASETTALGKEQARANRIAVQVTTLREALETIGRELSTIADGMAEEIRDDRSSGEATGWHYAHRHATNISTAAIDTIKAVREC